MDRRKFLGIAAATSAAAAASPMPTGGTAWASTPGSSPRNGPPVTFSVKDFGAVGNGVADDTAACRAAAAAALGGGGRVLFPPGTYRIASNLGLSTESTFDPGAKLKPTTGVTITLTKQPGAGLYQIFDRTGGGLIALSGPGFDRVVPQWWGALADGTTDDQPAFQAMFDAARRNLINNGGYDTLFRCTVHLPAGDYRIKSAVTILNSTRDTECMLTVQGDGWGQTRIFGNRTWIDRLPMHPTFVIKATGGNNRGWTVRGISFIGHSVAIDTLSSAYFTIRECLFADWTAHAIVTRSGGSGQVRHNHFWYGTHGSYAMNLGDTFITNELLVTENIIGEEVPHGIIVRAGSTKNVIANNVFQGTLSIAAGKAVALEGGAAGNVVRGNMINVGDVEGRITLNSGNHNVVAGNSMVGTIDVNGATHTLISGNVVSTALRYGVDLDASSSSNFVNGNLITAAAGGVADAAAGRNVVRDNLVNGRAQP